MKGEKGMDVGPISGTASTQQKEKRCICIGKLMKRRRATSQQRTYKG